jgi:probable F420-dependent oxidoreductase
MKVRIGIGPGGALGVEDLTAVADDIVALGFDSLWLSEVLTAPVLDPLVGLAWAGAHCPKLKLGTTMLLPGRNPIRLAKQLAGLDALSAGRLLVTFVPGLTSPPERKAIGVTPKLRGSAIEEALPLLQALWAGERVTHHGEAAAFDDVAIAPLPHQQPLEVWLGGMAPPALERCGRLADGWLPSLCTPADAVSGRRVIDEAADRAGRAISPEHFGVSIGYARAALDAPAVQAIRARSRGRAPGEVVPFGMGGLRDLVQQFIAVGFSKFVVRPLARPASWRAELEDLAGGIGDLQT